MKNNVELFCRHAVISTAIVYIVQTLPTEAIEFRIRAAAASSQKNRSHTFIRVRTFPAEAIEFRIRAVTALKNDPRVIVASPAELAGG